MAGGLRGFVAELKKSTEFVAKVIFVKARLSDWLNSQVYPDERFSAKWRGVLKMFVDGQLDEESVYCLVNTIDPSKLLTVGQINYLARAFRNNRKMMSITQKFVDGYRLSDDDISELSNYLVAQVEEVYQL
ncbi:unknown [Orgyia pseudotsugata multiple nucleopolyhedrovirus]|uniref:Uncharacterized 14.9 kDa protein n=1 Tax=Orgyia pseudotsugata multicapsid polyhedrosis virus TaxID=262177 RepID=Y075_NPVOP|nr:hypothetical protein OpmnVgp078 [Orgyia pseudotsugata multiple nucleopolyhedrovirus]O10328.1 RecName: Full=Uncharacterized 14.9 kDa protein [Orgyia pseudotsugata multiple nucleopolyhedrovirus]pir/T10347/ hypothetical protein 78 - Orgyia pseudotsugata nuclear polyhedrosis virus [Orgyia pseudotsugata single capsid nuclopolyhedrovirus]AKR14155.1 hypothetical protein [Dasychira pudibunda nucleopolyhedrovirus]AAC59077.1 unknown [Orgyia pseudotsugata multiple nucleopolyhedrovirus]WHM28385.1 hypot